MRKLIYLGLVLIFALAVIMKAQSIKKQRERETISLSSEYKKYGIPVDVFKVKKDNLAYYSKISGKFRNGEIIALIPPYVRSRVAEGQPFSAQYDDKDLKGYVASAGGLDIASGLYRAVFRFNSKVEIPQDSIITVNVKTSQTRKVTVVPFEVLNKDGENCFVWEVKDQMLGKRPVIVGERADQFVEIEKGIDPGALVIASIGRDFSEKTKVRVHKVLGE